MTMTKYGVDHAAVQALLDSGECQTEEEALEKVASGRLPEGWEDETRAKLAEMRSQPGYVPVLPVPIDRAHLDAASNGRVQLASLSKANTNSKENPNG